MKKVLLGMVVAAAMMAITAMAGHGAGCACCSKATACDKTVGCAASTNAPACTNAPAAVLPAK